jgi:hypothetical protein
MSDCNPALRASPENSSSIRGFRKTGGALRVWLYFGSFTTLQRAACAPVLWLVPDPRIQAQGLPEDRLRVNAPASPTIRCIGRGHRKSFRIRETTREE